MRAAVLAAAGACAVLLAVPGTAAADPIFDQADADDLVATLDEAYQAQRVCYGWAVTVNNVGIRDTSVGSNFGVGQSLDQNAWNCDAMVEFTAHITWTSASSESEDSASYTVTSSAGGPTTEDLNSLELISRDGVAGDNGDVEIYKAVSALPLLAADAGLADPIEATPAPESVAQADGGAPTNSPGSDFWRRAGGSIMWGAVLIAAAGVFAWWTLRSSKAAATAPARRAGPRPVRAPNHVPPAWSGNQEPSSGPRRPTAPLVAPPPGTEPKPGAGRGRTGPAATPGPARPGPATGAKNENSSGVPADKPDPETRPEG